MTENKDALRETASGDGPDGTLESLAVTANMLEKWGPETFPANEMGQIHFGRLMTDIAASEIRAFLANFALSTPQPESVEAAVERVTYAIILGSSGERAADHAKEFQTANWEDARRSAIAVIKAMPAATCNDGLQVALAEAIEALEKAASRFGHCADMIAMGFNASGTLRAEREIKARHYADETRAAAAQVVAKHGEGRS